MSVQATVWQMNKVFNLDEEISLNSTDPSLNRKRKGKAVIETVRPGRGKRWSDEEVKGLIGLRQTKKTMAGAYFLRILDRFWSVQAKCCI